MRLFYYAVISFVILSGCEKDADLSEQIANATHFELSEAQPAELVKDQSFSAGSHKTVNSMGEVAANDEGSLFVINALRKRIEVFDSRGAHIKSVGGIGRDPGDFQNPTYLKVQGDALYAYDQNLFRMYRYRLPELELETVTYLENKAAELEVDSLSDAKPFAAEVVNGGNYLVAFQIVDNPQNRQLFFYEVSPQGEVVSDQLFSFNNKSLYMDEAVDPPLIMMLPYEPENLFSSDSQVRFYTVNTDNFLITLRDDQGEEIESRYYLFEKHNLIRSDAIDLFTDTFQRRAIRRASLPEKWPALAEMFIDDEDRIWVAAIISDLNKYRWYVFESSGEPLASFELSRKKKIETIKNGFVYVKEFNARQYSDQVSRYRLAVQDDL